MIRNATLEDAAAIAGIYNHYIGNTVVTFEEQPVPTDDMRDRVADVIPKWPWLVFEENDAVIGYAYATQWNKRGAYRHSVESSVYLSPTATGRGIGRALYERLLTELRTHDLHAVIGGVALPA